MTDTAPILKLSPDDDVAVALRDLAAGDPVTSEVTARVPIATGHKVALHEIAADGPVRKYGQIIGFASRTIDAGEHVHSQNLVLRDFARPAGSAGTARRAAAPQANVGNPGFLGYVRPDGRVGTRNYIGIVTTVNCAATVAQAIAQHFAGRPAGDGIDGVVSITHGDGCGRSASGEGFEILQRTLAGYIRHPNFGGVLVIGLGCEVNQIDSLLANGGLVQGDRLRRLSIQESGGSRTALAAGIQAVDEMIEIARQDRRTPVGADRLVVGLQCGGSDAWSGITANPSLGCAVDRLVAAGGTAMLSETPEIFGAEHLLTSRAVRPEVAEALMARVAWWRDYAAHNGADLDNNPSPGNKAGGLTTIAEKSLGAVAKAGSSPLAAVYRYAEPVGESGLVFVDTPGYDPCSATGQMASGATLLCFTTGRGSVYGSKPAPCLKLASTSDLFRRMGDDMDIDCGSVVEQGVSVDAMGAAIFDLMLATASGQPSKSESFGLGDLEFVPWRLGAFL